MNCTYCQTNHRKFYCVDCIKEKLHEHATEFSITVSEKDTVVSGASQFLEKATVIQKLIAEKNARATRLARIRETQIAITNECNKKKQRIKELEKQLKEKKRILEESQKRQSHYQSQQTDFNNAMKAWQRTHKMTVGTRRILVKEVFSLFELKPGVIEEPESSLQPTGTSSINTIDLPPFSQSTPIMPIEGKEDLYICGVTLPTRLIDVAKYPKEELNAPIGLVIHMLGLVVRYLGIKLPFMIFHKGVRPYVRIILSNTPFFSYSRKYPLFLEDDDKNFEKFIHGMAMLNYNLAYLCHTQGVKIPVSQVANTLQSLMACCSAPGLGIQSHALYYQGLRDLSFPIGFQQVLRATSLRYRCSRDLDHNSDTKVTTNNELHDEYYKVRSIKTNSNRLLQEEEDEVFVDSDDDDYFMSIQLQHQQQIKQQQPVSQSETWSIVEVAPFLGGL